MHLTHLPLHLTSLAILGVVSLQID